MDARDTADDGDGRPDTGEVVPNRPHYNLRPRRGPEEIVGTEAGQGREAGETDRRTGATVVISGVDVEVRSPLHEPASEVDRGRLRDRREPLALHRRGGASSESSDAGSAFSSAPGSPVSAGGSRRAPSLVKTTSGEMSIGAGRRKGDPVSRDARSPFTPPAPPRPRTRDEGRDAPRRSHRHRSPPVFEDMSWADLEAYRKIHLAFQQQRLLVPPVTSRVHELAIRPDPSLLVGKRNEMDPLRAQMSTTFGTTVSQQPGRDGRHASRVSRHVSDTAI
jgi:hypothetical protein